MTGLGLGGSVWENERLSLTSHLPARGLGKTNKNSWLLGKDIFRAV